MRGEGDSRSVLGEGDGWSVLLEMEGVLPVPGLGFGNQEHFVMFHNMCNDLRVHAEPATPTKGPCQGSCESPLLVQGGS